MSLAAGTRVGPYEIIGLLGVGGMGEVYRARDAKLRRDVAIKVLPPAFKTDRDRLARFEREAQVLASLNHSNIGAIYGFQDGSLVLEFVDGPTLADRIAQGPIPLDEALPIARQIAEALEAAHECGVVHRDLKPANIKLRPDGTVKVLDFGLAKALESSAPAAAALSMSPTITSPALMTGGGVILGTAAYMSPEQARGKPVDKRSDIWAFGCVLYEMLTGRRPFDGTEVTDILARIIERDVDWTLLPQATPQPVRRLLRRCLQKDRKRRLPDIAVALIEIDESLGATPDEVSVAGGPVTGRGMRGRWTLAVAAAVMALVVAVAAFLTRGIRSADDPAWRVAPIRFSVAPPEGSAFATGDFAVPFAVSPDGRQIAFVAKSPAGQRQLWIRRLDSQTAQPLAGTEGAGKPFWSADSRRVAFLANSRLKTLLVADGTIQTVTTEPMTPGMGAAWSSNGVIVLSPTAASGLSRVPDGGGSLAPLSTLDSTRAEVWHHSPQFLPDGRHVLFSAIGTPSGIYVISIDGGPARLLAELADGASTLAYAPGYVLFVQNESLFARPFDEGGLEFTGAAVRLVDGIPFSGPGYAPFSLSSNGVLAYSQLPAFDASVLKWFDRDGAQTDAVPTPAQYAGAAVAPRGDRLAFSRFDANGARDLWIRDLRGGESKMTFDGDTMVPVWAPDGRTIAFASARDGNPPNLFTKPVAGGSEIRRSKARLENYPTSWSADGSSIVYEVADPRTNRDLWIVRLDGDVHQPLSINTRFNETAGALSYDGRWLAYTTDESGRNEVWVSGMTPGGTKHQVSVDGGSAPRWRADGKELFFVSDRGDLMAVPVDTTRSVFDDVPARLFSMGTTPFQEAGSYTSTADGRRFLASIRVVESVPVHVVLNWTSLVSGTAP
jgi:Tol biopolymer transport system component